MKNHLPYNPYSDKEQQLNMITSMAAVYCLLGYVIDEVAGMMIGTALRWSNFETLALAIGFAFLSGYLPILYAGYSYAHAARTALAADTALITIMEIIDNLIMLVISGAMDAQLNSLLF